MAGLSFSSWSSTKCNREVLRSVPFTSASFSRVSSLKPVAAGDHECMSLLLREKLLRLASLRFELVAQRMSQLSVVTD